ncbi:MAG: hypothetical protein ACERKO_07760 [Acetanaerobacterium sp.]
MAIKKMAVCCAAILLLSQLAACSKTAPSPEKVTENLSSSYNTRAVVSYQDIKADLELIKEERRCLVTFESPETLKDLSFDYTGDLVTVHYGKLNFSVNPDSVPGQALSSLLISSLNASLSDRGVTIEDAGSAIKILGQTDGSEFELILDRTKGNALSLSIPDDELSLEFYNFSFLE